MRKTSLTDPRKEEEEPAGILDPVYIACSSPAGYFLHLIDNQYYFCQGSQDAVIWSQEEAEEFSYRNQLRNFFLVPAGKPGQDI